MATAVAGVTTAYTLSTSTPTAAKANTSGSPHRRLIIITNLDNNNYVGVAFGTNNAASATACHLIPPYSNMVLGGPANIAGAGNMGSPVPPGDISLIAITGSPNVSVLVCD